MVQAAQLNGSTDNRAKLILRAQIVWAQQELSYKKDAGLIKVESTMFAQQLQRIVGNVITTYKQVVISVSLRRASAFG